MASARYQLPQHPTLSGPHTKEELYVLVERGSLGRGEIVTDRLTGRSHKVGELIGGMRPPRSPEPLARMERPAYQEFSGDAPWEDPMASSGEVGASLDLTSEDEDDDEDMEPPDNAALCYHGHPSWLSYGKPMLLCLLLIGGAIACMPLSAKYFIIGVVLASFAFCCVIIARQQRDYFVSNAAVELEWGLVGRRCQELPLEEIRDIDVHKSGMLGLLGVGTVVFSAADPEEDALQFEHVRNPHRLMELVLQLQRRVLGPEA